MNFHYTGIRILFSSLLLLSSLCTDSNSYCQGNWNTELLGRWGEGSCEAIEVDQDYIYVGNGSCIDVYQNIEEPVKVARLETPGIIRFILRANNYLYVADEEYGLRIFDVSNIYNPSEVGFLLLPGYTLKLLFRDGIIYSANFHGGLRIINVLNPVDPKEISSYETGFQVDDLAIMGNYLFVTQGERGAFAILDINDPYFPILVRLVYPPIFPMCPPLKGIAIKGQNIFVLSTDDRDGFIFVYSIADPTDPQFKFGTYINGTMISLSDNYAFIPYSDQIQVVDISVQDTLSIIQTLITTGEKKSIKCRNNILYVADTYNGLVIIDISDIQNPICKYHISSAYNTGYLTADDSLLFVSNMGLRILDITDPSYPQTIGVFQTIYGTDQIYKRNNLVFLVDLNIGGLRIMDVENPNYPNEISLIKPPQNIINSVSEYQAFLYLAQLDSLGIWDISLPTSPAHSNTIPLSGYCSEIIIKDGLLITCQDPGGIIIYNLTDPEHPQLISAYIPEFSSQYLALQGNYLIAGSYAGFEIIDIKYPSKPSKVSFFSTPHIYDLAAANNYLYIAFAETGIKVYDLNNIANPQEVGFYDTKGIAWSVDCREDKIFVADSRYGVSIIRNTLITDSREQENIPLSFEMSQNYPNPFNPSTTISYSLPEYSNLEIKVFDILGNEIETLIDEEKPAGQYEINWNAAGLPSGVYFYRLQSGDFVSIKKMILLQ